MVTSMSAYPNVIPGILTRVKPAHPKSYYYFNIYIFIYITFTTLGWLHHHLGKTPSPPSIRPGLQIFYFIKMGFFR